MQTIELTNVSASDRIDMLGNFTADSSISSYSSAKSLCLLISFCLLIVSSCDRIGAIIIFTLAIMICTLANMICTLAITICTLDSMICMLVVTIYIIFVAFLALFHSPEGDSVSGVDVVT